MGSAPVASVGALVGALEALQSAPSVGGNQPAAKTSKAKQPKQTAKPSRSDVLAKSQEQDDAVLALLKTQPGMRTGQIAQTLKATKSTLLQRMQRLADRGQVRRDGQANRHSAMRETLAEVLDFSAQAFERWRYHNEQPAETRLGEMQRAFDVFVAPL